MLLWGRRSEANAAEEEDRLEYKDYYSSLGVKRSASPEEIHRAYRKLARRYHPDVNNDAGAEDRFKEISEAYEALKDPEKRTTYDRFGSNWRQGGGAPPGYENVHADFGGMGGGRGFGGSGFSSFFDMLFNERGGRSAGGFGDFQAAGGGPWAEQKPADQEAILALTLEEAVRGGARELTVADPVSGRSNTYTVNLPKGVRPGQKIRLAGRGGRGRASMGDLYLKVELKPHDRFRLDGRDLYCELAVSPWEAALGGEVPVRTLDGVIKVRIPPGTSSGRKIRLRGHGFPDPKSQAGDLYAEVRVAVPKELSSRERELFEELAQISSFRPAR